MPLRVGYLHVMRQASVLITGLLIASCSSSTEPLASSRTAVQSTDQPEVNTLSKKPLARPTFSAEQRAKLEADLAAAQADFDKNPRDPERAIWLGRRLGYLGRYRDAIATYTTALALHPDNATLYRHRGHRHISLRRFDDAVADFEKAASLIKGVPDEIRT